MRNFFNTKGRPVAWRATPVPNFELRLDVAVKSGFVNIHLLVTEDAEHLSEVKRILNRLQLHAFNDRFDWSREELIKIGKRADAAVTDAGAALRHSNAVQGQLQQLHKVIDESEWAKKKILIAVAGGAETAHRGSVRLPRPRFAKRSKSSLTHLLKQPGAA